MAAKLCLSATHAALERAKPRERRLPLLPGWRAAHFRQLFPFHFAAEPVALRGAMAMLPRDLSYRVLVHRGVWRGRAGVTQGYTLGRCSLAGTAASSAPARLRPSKASWMCRGLPCWAITAGDYPGVPRQGSPALTL